MYTQDGTLRQGIVQLLDATVCSAIDAAQHQQEQLLMLLLRMRSNVMLDSALDISSLDQVSVQSSYAAVSLPTYRLSAVHMVASSLFCALILGCTYACRVTTKASMHPFKHSCF